MVTKEEILEGIKELSILDVSWLVKQLEEEFGVTAAAPVAVAAAPAAATGGGGMSIGNVQVREINQVWISTIFFYSVVIQSLGNGLAAGFMSTGRFYSAATRASVMLLIGWAVFEFFGIGTSLISPGVL